jgi:NAD(P)-dependent dehydrogenase (short-subunit alcohol dehydrogenase family)
MAINLRAPLVLIQGLLAQLPAAGEANVVNLIDARVLNLTPHYTSYTVSKAGLWVLTQHLARALAPRVRVNAIAPGPVLPHAGMSEEAFAALARATPLGRGPSVEEICRALRAILEAPAMTGQLLTLDGGRHLGWLLPGERDTPERMA